MGQPELPGSTIERPNTSHRVRAAPHQHGPPLDDGPTTGPDAALVALAIALQDGCHRCVQFHAGTAGRQGAPRLQVLEALGTALLLSTPHAARWPRLAETALSAHQHGRS